MLDKKGRFAFIKGLNGLIGDVQVTLATIYAPMSIRTLF